MDLGDLKDVDELREIQLGKCKCFVHKEHRWVLSIIYHAQGRGLLPRPCTLVMFDAHHDSKRPACMERIRRIRAAGITFDELVSLCKDSLSPLDDDWVMAGMELGLISDAVIFAGADLPAMEVPRRFTDHVGDVHRIELAALPGRELQYQGRLSDVARKKCLSELWSILGWRHAPADGFAFAQKTGQILLDFDLDCFVVHWKEYYFPWPDEVFCNEFYRVSDYSSTKGWSGKRFLDGLVHRAAVVTVAMEPNHCGGEDKAQIILGKVGRFLFSD